MEIDELEMQEIDNIFNDAYKKTTTLREAWRYAMMRYAEIYHDREVKKLNQPDVSVVHEPVASGAVCPHFNACQNGGKNEYCDLQTFNEIDCFVGQTER